jgi:fibronectin type 3 domain-containing protein
VLIAALTVVGCGKVGSPVAPEIRVPAPVSNLRGVVEEDTVVLEWTNPQRRVDQGRLRNLMETRLYRTDDDGVVPPKPALLAHGRIAGYRELARIPVAPTGTDAPRVSTVRFVDGEGLRHGRRYTYVVIAEDGEGRISPPSNRLSVTLIAPPEAPPAPTATAGDGEVHLRWQPPARLVDGGPPGPLAHEVLRAGTADSAPDAVFLIPPGQTEYVDRGVANERTYHYAVRAVRESAGTVARGAPSPRVAATPGRATAPAPPTSLVAAPSADAVRLSWTASPDRDVAGYVVYRADGAGEATRIGSVRAPATTFTDRGLGPGTYRYAVTAQDASARANESAPSNEVSVTLP